MLKSPPDTEERLLSLLSPLVKQGMDSAAAGLSEMLETEIRVKSTGLTLASLTAIPSLVSRPDDVVTGIYLAIFGEISGHIVLVFSEQEALRLVDMLMGLPKGSTSELDDMAVSALGELGNITASRFITTLADTTMLSAYPSPPAIAQDMCGAILDIALIDIGQEANETILIDTVFSREDQEASGSFLIMPNPSSLVAIRDSLES